MFCIADCRKGGNIRRQHLKQQSQRYKELQKTTQQFVYQPQTPRKNEYNSHIQRNKAVEHQVSRIRTSRKNLIITNILKSSIVLYNH